MSLSLPSFPIVVKNQTKHKYSVVQADLLDYLANPPEQKFHAVLSDPPYFLGSITKRFGKRNSAPAKYGKDGSFGRLSKGFMGKTWDGFQDVWEYQAWITAWAELLIDWVYPGAVLAMFGGTRTYHRLASGLEDAGWEIFDSGIALWTYGSGFPKAADVGKLIDKADGAERKVIGKHPNPAGNKAGGHSTNFSKYGMPEESYLTAPASEESAKWEGFKNVLKPAYEPIVLARAPRSGGFGENARQYGTGALNIGAARIGDEERTYKGAGASPHKINGHATGDTGIGMLDGQGSQMEFSAVGRYPANLLLGCECEGEHVNGCAVGEMEGSRYFYNGKSAAWEREAGLDNFQFSTINDGREKPIDNPYQRGKTERRNTHPTLKPIELATWLAKLLLPPELNEPRRLLVPFCGTGSEMLGGYFAGWDEILGIEREAEYVALNSARADWWLCQSSYESARKFYRDEQRAAKAAASLEQLSFLDE